MIDVVRENYSRVVVGSPSIADGELTLTTTAQALPAHPCRRVLVRAAATNAGTAYVGDDTPVLELAPGELVVFWIDEASLLYAKGTAGDKIQWLAED